MKRHGSAFALAVMLTLGACSPGSETTDAAATAASTSSASSPTPTIQDIMELEPFAPLEPGTYFIDPDGDPSTPLRVVYEVSVEGWSMWIGAARFADEGTVCSSSGCPGRPSHVGVSITTVTNLVRHGCRDHSWADPPVGPSVDDLATALADLAPFRVTSAPKDLTIYGYSGKHLELTVPDCRSRGRETTSASPDVWTATSRAGSGSSTQPKKGTRSTATQALATGRSSGSSTSKAPV